MKKNTPTFSLQGFSLIELMIVVLMISILTAVALPSYRHYALRARFTEVIAAAEPYKIAVSLALQEGYALDDLKNNIAGIPSEPTPTKHLANLTVENGVITAQGTALVKNASYVLSPNSEGNLWTVEGTCLTLGLCES